MATPALRIFKTGQLPPSSNQPHKPCLFRLPRRGDIVDKEFRLRHYHVGETQRSSSFHRPEKIVLIVGETGAGKTTLINNIVNSYYQIQWDYHFRLILVSSEDEGNPAANQNKTESQTDWITAYTLHWHSGCAMDYTLTLIDTPGYNDPRGVQHDDKTTARLRKFFTLSSVEGGIDQIDGVCFVIKSSTNRLTSAQRYVFHSVLSLFGKDIEKSIVLMVTHAGTGQPDAITAAKEAGIPSEAYFKFDNGVLLSTNMKLSIQEGDSDDEDYSAIDADSITWGRNMKQMNKFYRKLTNLRPQSLQLTQEVLAQRERLRSILRNHKEEIDAGLINLINLNQQDEYLTDYSSTSNIDPGVVQPSIVSRKLQAKPLLGAERATNCDICKRTCHYPCTLDNQNIWQCWAMDYRYYEVLLTYVGVTPRVTNCIICPNKCPSSSHSNANFQYEYIDDTQPLTLEYIRQQHQPEEEELSLSQLNERVSQKAGKMRVQVQKLLTETHSIILRLDNIALRPQKDEVSGFIQEMIYEEERSGRDDWEDRVDQLRCVLKHDKLIEEIKRYSSNIIISPSGQ